MRSKPQKSRSARWRKSAFSCFLHHSTSLYPAFSRPSDCPFVNFRKRFGAMGNRESACPRVRKNHWKIGASTKWVLEYVFFMTRQILRASIYSFVVSSLAGQDIQKIHRSGWLCLQRLLRGTHRSLWCVAVSGNGGLDPAAICWRRTLARVRCRINSSSSRRIWALPPSQIRASATESALMIPDAAHFRYRYLELQMPAVVIAGDEGLIDTDSLRDCIPTFRRTPFSAFREPATWFTRPRRARSCQRSTKWRGKHPSPD